MKNSPPKELPSFRIYFHEDLDGSFVVEEETTGHRYLDMRPHDIELFLYDLQEQCNLDGMSMPSSPSLHPGSSDSTDD